MALGMRYPAMQILGNDRENSLPGEKEERSPYQTMLEHTGQIELFFEGPNKPIMTDSIYFPSLFDI